jgi:hypothetical protein
LKFGITYSQGSIPNTDRGNVLAIKTNNLLPTLTEILPFLSRKKSLVELESIPAIIDGKN